MLSKNRICIVIFSILSLQAFCQNKCRDTYFDFLMDSHQELIKVKSVISRDSLNCNRITNLSRYTIKGELISKIQFATEGSILKELNYEYYDSLILAREYIYDESMITDWHKYMRTIKNTKRGKQIPNEYLLANPFARTFKHYHRNDSSFVDSYIGGICYEHEESETLDIIYVKGDTTVTSEGIRVSQSSNILEKVSYYSIEMNLLKVELFTKYSEAKLLALFTKYTYDNYGRVSQEKHCVDSILSNCSNINYSYEKRGDTVIQKANTIGKWEEIKYFISNVLIRKETFSSEDYLNGLFSRKISIYNANGLLIRELEVAENKLISCMNYFYTFW